MGKVVVLLSVALAVFLGYFLLAPAALQPESWTPESAPTLEGPLEQNSLLRKAEVVARGNLQGPEDVALGDDGYLYAGLIDGRIVRIDANEEVTALANTGGRPLGLHFDSQQRLVIADARLGLLRLTHDHRLERLSVQLEGPPINFADDLDISRDGTIFFSDASWKWSLDDFHNDVLEARPYGRLIRYHPDTNDTEVLLDNLYFANGVALSAEEDFVLVCETARYRVTRYWLKGPKAGESDIFIDNLPGFPDGIARDANGRFWLALAALRDTTLDAVHPHPWLKKLVSKLPESLKPIPAHYGLIVQLSPEGEILQSLHDPEGRQVFEITSVQPAGDQLLLGTLQGDRVAKITPPEVNR